MSASLGIYVGKQPKQKLFKFNNDTGKLISSQAHFLGAGLRGGGGGGVYNDNGGLDACRAPSALTRTHMDAPVCVGDVFTCAWFHFGIMPPFFPPLQIRVPSLCLILPINQSCFLKGGRG